MVYVLHKQGKRKPQKVLFLLAEEGVKGQAIMRVGGGGKGPAIKEKEMV